MLAVILVIFFLFLLWQMTTGTVKEQFFLKLPYNSLSARHYKKTWKTKTHPKCIGDGTCPNLPGYYLNYHEYLDKNNYHNVNLGHSLYGTPYQTRPLPEIAQTGSRKYYDLLYPEYTNQYPTWYDYTPKRSGPWHSNYIGYPWYYR